MVRLVTVQENLPAKQQNVSVSNRTASATFSVIRKQVLIAKIDHSIIILVLDDKE